MTDAGGSLRGTSTPSAASETYPLRQWRDPAMAKKTIDDVDVAGKRIRGRVDFNAPPDAECNNAEDTTIRGALTTLWQIGTAQHPTPVN